MSGLMPAESPADLRGIKDTTILAPPDRAFVSLSHAVSWAAFGNSLNAKQFAQRLAMSGIATKNPLERNILLDLDVAEAIDRIVDLARRGEIRVQGKFLPSMLADETNILIAVIPPIALSNYQRFEVEGDALYRGRGLAWKFIRRDLPAVSDDHYREVAIERADLLRAFPARAKPIARSTVKAEQACERWLVDAFRGDPFNERAKTSFRAEAFLKFAPSLSVRGFDRAWAAVAPDTGRNTAGAKSKRRFDSPV